MKGVALLALRHALHDRTKTSVLTACIAVCLIVPSATRVLIGVYQEDLTARAAATPLVAGAKGNRFDLTFAALYFRKSQLELIRRGTMKELVAAPGDVVVPLHLRFEAQGYPVVGTTPEYFEERALRVASGTLPLVIGEVVVGAHVARELGLEPGDPLYSDQPELYDISKPSALELRVTGALAESGTPDDGAVFVDVKTSWILEGIWHGHDDPVTEVAEELVLAQGDGAIMLSEALIEYNRITEENAETFHVHGDPDELPLSAFLVFPADTKSATLIKARTNASKELQMVVPAGVIDDLLAFVFRIRAFLDKLSIVLAISTFAMTALVLLLSARVRRGEIRTLHRIGASRHTVLKLYAFEVVFVVGASTLLAAAALAGVYTLAPNLSSLLR